MASQAFGDRTKEFFAAIESFKGQFGGQNASHSQARGKRPNTKSEFYMMASNVGKQIHAASLKLAELAKLAKRVSLFDDPAEQIEELTSIIKKDITTLNQQIGVLHEYHQQKRGTIMQSAQSDENSASMVDSLKTMLATTTKEFSDVLHKRTENLKAQQNRRSQFSSSAFSGSDTSGLSKRTDVVLEMGEGSENQGDSGERAQLVADPVYLRSRATAIQSIEKTTVELGQIFQQLATMVSEQGDMVQRIDSDVADVETNVEGAQEQLLKYMHKISSNRALMLKTFSVVLFFVFLFFFVLR